MTVINGACNETKRKLQMQRALVKTVHRWICAVNFLFIFIL